MMGMVRDEMATRLQAALRPTAMALVDESDLHAGHAGHDGRGESHFRLDIESAAFAGKSRVERQRLVNAALADLLAGRVHALTIKARAPGEG